MGDDYCHSRCDAMDRYEHSQGIGAACLSGQMAVHTALSSDTLVMLFILENAVDPHSVGTVP